MQAVKNLKSILRLIGMREKLEEVSNKHSEAEKKNSKTVSVQTFL